MMKANARGITTVAVVGVAFLMVFVLPSGLAAAASPAGSVPASEWAYGAVKTISVSGTSASGWQYQGSATFGYSVILNQTNTTTDGSTFELSINRTMGVLFTINFCYPSCAKAVYTANESYHSWESEDAWANFTTLGNVTEGTTVVPALALVNSHSTIVGHLLEVDSSTVPTANRTRSLAVNVSGDAEVNFSSPLGLLPLNLSPSAPASWTSSSAFVASGSAGWGYTYAFVGPVHTVSISKSGAVAVAGSGTVSVQGLYTLGNTVSFGGVTYPAIELTVTGPFAVREGIILVPDGSDLFGGSTQPWSGNESGTATASMTAVDARPTAGGHFGLVASAWLYSASGSIDSGALAGSGAPQGLAPATSNAAPAPPTTVQGIPQSPASSQQNQSCLIAGNGCPGATSGSGPAMLPRGLLAVGAVVVIAAVVGLVLVAERRRMPPPSYPNANLYPPGSGSTARWPSGRGPSDEPEPAEDDPLGNLW